MLTCATALRRPPSAHAAARVVAWGAGAGSAFAACDGAEAAAVEPNAEAAEASRRCFVLKLYAMHDVLSAGLAVSR
eukprot:5386533-Pleurochrysis_carterae.AAC.1